MVTFQELRDAKPALWTTAANDMRRAAAQCEGIRDDIELHGVRPLAEHWEDQIGELARQVLKTVADEATVASILARSSVDLVDTLGHAVEMAQNELEMGIRAAQSAGLEVNEASGQVTIPGDYSTDEVEQVIGAQRTAQKYINDAIEAATQADRLCADALTETNRRAPGVNEDDAKAIQADSTKKALNALRDTLPDGLPPEAVEAWWNGLSDQQRTDLERALPLELYDLPGIPNSVRDSLDRRNLGYSSLGTVRYATENGDNRDIDIFDDDCTHFVSTSLADGGHMPQKGTWELLTMPKNQTDGWNDGNLNPGAQLFPGPGPSHTPTWAVAQANHDYFLNHGGAVVNPTEARPGDVVYWTQVVEEGGDNGKHAGQVHHAAVVTGVLPDGQVLYTQHSDSALNYPLAGRLPEFENMGQQMVEIVRPTVTW